MKHANLALKFGLSIFLINVFMACCTINVHRAKLVPEYKGVDPAMQSIVNEYLSLAKDKGITFKHKVTAGFTDIKSDMVIGICNLGSYFREIDIDSNYWNRATSTSKMTLLFHELSHCYCNRDHDYAKGKPYGPASDSALHENNWFAPKKVRNSAGRYSDDCPLSIMYPEILDDDCMRSHYTDYINEMFARCEAY